jgi:hypothetical protein
MVSILYLSFSTTRQKERKKIHFSFFGREKKQSGKMEEKTKRNKEQGQWKIVGWLGIRKKATERIICYLYGSMDLYIYLISYN